MATQKSQDDSIVTEKRVSQWEVLMRKFSEAHKDECKNVSLDIPRVARSIKQFPTGSQYEGTWDVLGMSGYGTYLFPNGVIYEGEFNDGMFHGSGELRYPCGAILRGKWKRGVLLERTLVFADGLEYSEKDWNYCKMPDRRVTEKRVSQWEVLMRKFSEAHKDECKNVSLDIPRVARSIKQFPTGSQYEGTWDVLGMSGYGTYLFPNGVIYEGEFNDGMFHGSGELRYPCGAILRGKWKRGVLLERTLVFADGLEYSEKDWNYCKMPDRRVTEKRVSQWEVLMRKFSEAHKDECKNVSLDIPRVARSIKQFPTGSQYEGTWDVLGMSGYGTYLFPNGVIYEGEFNDGMFHGSGELRYPCGAILRGKWKRGVLLERTLVFADGLEYSEKDWNYCKMPDRRFAIEYEQGVQPAGRSFLTAEQPTREIPPGHYDTGDGFYDPKTKVVYKADDLTAIIRSPLDQEQKWIVENCRKAPEKPLGPRPDLYEQWVQPQVIPERQPKPMIKNKTQPFQQPPHPRLDSEVEMSIRNLQEPTSDSSND